MTTHQRSDEAQRLPVVRLYVGILGAVAALIVGQLVALDVPLDPGPSGRIPALLFAVLLFIGETQPRLWMRWGDQAQITPGWAFAYAVVLVGSPLGAVIAVVLTHLYTDVRHRKGALKIAFNASQVAVSLSCSALVLHVFGVDDGILDIEHLPVQSAIGILIGGIVTFVVNGALLTIVISLHQGVPVRSFVNRSYVMSIAADAALLALAPVFVIAIEFSTLMVPLLAITAFLVYHSARNALKSEHEANHDPLTLLLNRRAFDERLAKAVDEAEMPDRMALVLVMDLDRFKDINDRLGHPIGDRLLRSFAERLERILPGGAFASRLGGDEFAVLLPNVASVEAAWSYVRRWHAELSEPHDLSGFPLTSAVSIGAALAPQHGRSGAALTAAADVAMYRAKQRRSGVEFATSSDGVHDVGRVGLLNDIAEALRTDQMFAHYQPLVRLSDGSIESVEALVRWEHPVHGLIPPSDFIGMVEHTDLIAPLTEMMFRTAIRDVQLLDGATPKLSVNVAARSLGDRQFAATVLSIMREAGFPPTLLEIEIIERDIVTSSERSLLALSTLREHGVRVAIDDFGTGYSSFLTLRDLHADRLKIDQQFTANIIHSPADELIVTKLVEIAHALGLDVVAEGVESYEVWERLREIGCDLAQGYAIARPMPISELVAWASMNAQRAEAEHATDPAEPSHSTPRLKVVAS
jgi:diguanylate cyclase (GGDEF)-like protein